jgi:hypothetical protein
MYKIREWISAKFGAGIQHYTLLGETGVIHSGPISAKLHEAHF